MSALHIRSLLALSVAAALLAPGVALAQTAKEQELEARVAQLEQQVQSLLQAMQTQQATTTQVQATLDQVRVAPPAQPADDGKPKMQGTPILTAGNPGSRFSFGGFVKLDAMYTDTNAGEIPDGTAGRMFYLPSSIPVGGLAESNGDTDWHAQWSRFWLAADSDVAGKKARAYVEMDFFGGGNTAFLGNEVSTNTYGVTLRQAYVQWDKWLAGQAWSNFQDVAALPDAVDFVGPTEGTTFVRQAQLRYTSGPWSFSLENPETVVTGWRSAARTISDDNALPDITARWTSKGDWGHVGVAGLVRQLRHETATSQAEGTGYGVSLSGKVNMGASDDIRWAVNGGSGIGRYLAFGVGSDVVADASGQLDALDGYGGFVAWRHVFSPKVRTNLMYAASHFDNDTGLTGWGVTERTQSFHANVIYSPFPKLDLGAELIYGQRSLEDDREGDLRRLHTSVKYSF